MSNIHLKPQINLNIDIDFTWKYARMRNLYLTHADSLNR